MIRPMEKSDIPRVAEINVFGWRCAYRGIVPDEHMFKTRLVTTHMEKLIERWDNNNGFEGYVYDDGIVKAILNMGPCPEEDKAGAFELGVIYVDPCFKGEGIGTALALFCEKIAAERGYKEIILWTFEKNAPARAFYEKLGYKTDGKTMLVGPYEAVGVGYCKNI
ncbi:MAG: GNAT family N-acetyltransferase [Defluviitaleaceae bacterium]|nr:GNAT family N-acetyltransferase [Defluviitaleaceae bacterium]